MKDKLPKENPVYFHSLDRQAEIEITLRNLPHWFQSGVAIFVTFRTDDSLPAHVLFQWQRELEQWLELQGLPIEVAGRQFGFWGTSGFRGTDSDNLLERLTPNQQREFKKLNDRIFHRSLDECHGRCLLRRPELAKIVGDAILFFDDDRYDLDRFIVMPNHVHAIVQFRSGHDLDTVSQSRMRFTARQINRQTSCEGAFWQPEPFDHIIRSPEQFAYLQHYITDNPQKARLAPSHYLYWQRT